MKKLFLLYLALWRPFFLVLALFLPLGARAQTAGWTVLAPSQTPRWVGNPVVAGNKLLVFSGFDNASVHTSETNEVYDPATNQWVYLANMPTPVTHAGLALDGDLVYIAGGFTGTTANSNLLQIYNTTTNTWSQGPALPQPSGGHALVRLGRKLHSFGGLTEDRETGALTHFVLDLEAMHQGWSTAAPMPLPRCHFATAVVAGKIYALGGQTGHDATNADVGYVHVYDPASDTWSRLNDMPYGRSHSETATFVLDGRITLAGGKTEGEKILNTVTTYDPATDTWTELAPLPAKIFGPSAKVIGQELFVTNGSHEGRNSPKTEAYKRAFASNPQYLMGFAPGQLELSLAQGERLTRTAYLWSLSGSPAYQLDTTSLPAWLQVGAASGTIDVAAGTQISLTADAGTLAPGTYSATLRARASGYPEASMTIALQVTASRPRVLYLYGSMPPANTDMKLSDTGIRGMSQFQAAVEEAGFAISEALDTSLALDSAALASYQVLILGSNNRRFTDSERLAVDRWVKAGGGLVAWSDAAFGWADGGMNATAGALSNNDLTRQFGMEFLRDNGAPVFTLTQWAENHYLNRFNSNGGISIEAEGASPIRTTAPATMLAALPVVARKLNALDGTLGPNDAALSVARVGLGRVVGVFDRNTFWNEGEGTRLSRADNKLFAQRLLLWAGGIEETAPAMPPVVAAPVADFAVAKNSSPTTLNLNQVFSDAGGAASLTLSVRSNTDPALVTTALDSSSLTLRYAPESLGTAEITIRATDPGGLWVEDKFLVTVSSTLVQPVETVAYRINAGGTQLTTSMGAFAADNYFAGGNIYSTTNAIAGTEEDAMYQTERTASANNGSFGYSFPLSNGQYKVVLHFAELYWHSEGKRLFDVNMEGTLVLDNYDIYKKTGGNFIATTETMSLQVQDGSLDILFSSLAGEGGADRPKVSAIEILAVEAGNQLPVANAGPDKTLTLPANSLQLIGTGTDADGLISGYTWSQVGGPSIARFSNFAVQNPTISNLVAGTYTFKLVVKDNINGFSTPDQVVVTVQPAQVASTGEALYRLNAGGSQQSTSLGTFAPDAHFVDGYVYSNAKAIADTDNDAIYQSERSSTTNNGTFSYAFPVASGQYLVVLHFAELYWSSVGKRVFDVKAEGSLVLDNYDIVKKVGVNFAATTETLVVQVADSVLNLDFSAASGEGGKDRPKVSAIEVFPATDFNKIPAVSAGTDKNITLPASGVTLTGTASDSDGSISSYAWSQTSGPAAATLSGANTASLTASGLVAGSYVFRLTATDNGGTSAFDEATVTVIDASPAGQSLVSFSLMNAETNLEIRTLVPGETLNLATLPTQKLNIRANTNPQVVGSVKMSLTGAQSKHVTESGAPYSLFGDNGGMFYSWTPALGNYTLTGTPYSSSDGGGTMGTALTLSFQVVNQALTNPVVYRLNAGGSQQATSGGTFAADAYFADGYPYSKTEAIAGTQDDAIYQTERSATALNGSFSYAFPISNGEYKVVLHYAELYWGAAGRRVFDVKAEGALARDNFDIFQRAGAGFTAITDTLLVQVADGTLNLDFSAALSEGGADRPKVSALEVLMASVPNQPPAAMAGEDQTLVLPASSLTLPGAAHDLDGSISSYAWSQTSGPSAATLSGATTASLTASGLVAGTYVFRLTVTDNQGATGYDEVTVTVNNAAQPAGQSLVSFTLMSAETNLEIRTLVPGETLNLATLPTQKLNIRANTNPQIVGSVKMSLTGAQTRQVTESGAPYALFGDNNGSYYAWTPMLGSYSLTGTPYTYGGGSGTAGTPLTLSFSVVNQAPAARLNMASAPAAGGQLQAYPNPVAAGRFQVSLPMAMAGEVTYELVSALGRQLARGTARPDAGGVLRFDFARQMQARGIYFLRLNGENLNTQLKLMSR